MPIASKRFASALEERGLFLARGDRRGFVAINIDGDVFAISRLIGGKAKDVAARLGDPCTRMLSVDDAPRPYRIRHCAAPCRAISRRPSALPAPTWNP
jgi:hypothetical protein